MSNSRIRTELPHVTFHYSNKHIANFKIHIKYTNVRKRFYMTYIHILFFVKNMANCVRKNPVREKEYNARELDEGIRTSERHTYGE